MDIPQFVQDLLKCDECDELLSCGPIFMMHDTGETVCGRCSHHQHLQAESENRDKSRNNKYEAVAKLLSFPCMYAEQGCPKKMDFSVEQPNNHELNCEFRRFICPLVPAGECNWVGSWKNLEAHCRDKHSTQLLENNRSPPKPDITTSNLNTYLISAFNFLFLLHVKVCVSSGKLLHAVRMFGDEKFLNDFSFNFIVEGNAINFSKFGPVLSAHCFTLQESSAVCTKINLLLEILNGKYNECKFMVKIRAKQCLYCGSEIKNVSDLKCCAECEEKIVKCKYHKDGCLFADYTKNMYKWVKHEMFFCQHPTKCCLCAADLAGGSIFEHFESSNSCRKIISKCNIGSVVRVTPNATNDVDYILFSRDGNDTLAVVTFMLKSGNLAIWLRTSHPSHELKNLKCSVILTDPQTNYTETVTPELLYNIDHDWCINMSLCNFPGWENQGIDLSVNIGAEL